MISLWVRRRNKLRQELKKGSDLPINDDVIISNEKKSNPQSKVILAYVGDKLVGEYDSLTKCANILGLSRPMVKKAIENGTTLDNGFILKFK